MEAPKYARQYLSDQDCVLCGEVPGFAAAVLRDEIRLATERGLRVLEWGGLNFSHAQKVYILPEIDDAFAKIRAGDLSGDAANELDIDTASLWLSQCLSTHQRCLSNKQPEQFPTRLLEILDDVVYLVDCKESRPDGPCATLSHCWGKEPFPTLTNDNIDRHRAGVLIAEFMPTFRHALLVTRKLHIRYLWFDCYCIFQSDDTGDWDLQNQLAHMGEVYFNAILNIGLGYASSPFDTRRKPGVEKTGIQLRPKNPIGPRSYRLLQHVDVSNYLEAFDTENNTFQRAWCLQERLLCPHTLHFGQTTVFWECHELPLASKSLPTGLSRPLWEDQLRLSLRHRTG